MAGALGVLRSRYATVLRRTYGLPGSVDVGDGVLRTKYVIRLYAYLDLSTVGSAQGLQENIKTSPHRIV